TAQAVVRCQLVDAIRGGRLHDDKAGVILDHLAPILTRIGLDAAGWRDVVFQFGRVFKRAAGTP
ncbi:MAG: hypothetical protein ABJ378_12700, partial [Rhodopirellula bahusiensis]